MYKHWPDLTGMETVGTILGAALVICLLLRWAQHKNR